MGNDIFKNIIKETNNFDDEDITIMKCCSICGEPVLDFVDEIYGGYCEECFNEAQESRLK